MRARQHEDIIAAQGSTRWWRRIREDALARDDHLCVVCRKRGLLVPAEEVDHILARKRGGTNKLENLQSLCGKCHSRKTVRDRLGKDWSGFDSSGMPLSPLHPWNRPQD